jgi:hypothetical protein
VASAASAEALLSMHAAHSGSTFKFRSDLV